MKLNAVHRHATMSKALGLGLGGGASAADGNNTKLQVFEISLASQVFVVDFRGTFFIFFPPPS